MEPHELYDDKFKDLVGEAAAFDLASSEAKVAMTNLRIFSECRPPAPQPEPIPEFCPTTFLEKVKAGAARIGNNETTRVLIKTFGAFAGVAVVAYSTIYKDHVMERQALAQANQRVS